MRSGDGLAPMSDPVVVPIDREVDIVVARQTAREMAGGLGFTETERTLVATAVSEIARNIVQYGDRGQVRIEPGSDGVRSGIVITATDSGPGIPDIDKAMTDGFSTGKGLGLGLPGARRLMDEFAVTSTPGTGTTIVMKKWSRNAGKR